MNKAGAGEASGQSQGSHGHMKPQCLSNCISDPGIKFEESSHLVPQFSEVITFGPCEDTFEELATQALQISKKSHNEPLELFL